MRTGEQAGPPPPTSKRKRRVRSRLNCLPCRTRKSKCDRDEPCLSCVLRGTEQQCLAGSDTEAGDEVDGETRMRPSKRRTAGALVATATTRRIETPPLAASMSLSAVLTTTDALEAIVRLATDAKQCIVAGDSSSRDDRRLRWSSSSTLSWDEIDTLLPSDEEVDQLCDCFFSDLNWYQCGVQRASLDVIWGTARSTRQPIARHRIALLCNVLAFSLLLAPPGHPAFRLAASGRQSLTPQWQIENTRMLLDAYYDFATHREEEHDVDIYVADYDHDAVLGQLQAEVLYCYYCSVAGLVKRCRFSIGRCVQLSRWIDLFDESRWSPAFSHEQCAQRRRIAWDLIVIERWSAMHTGRVSALSGVLRLAPASTNECVTARNQLADMVSHVLVLLDDVRSQVHSMASLAVLAEAVDANLCDYYERLLPPTLQFHVVRDKRVSDINAAPALLYYLSHLFLRSTTMRFCLLNPAAPLHLRFASLQHARSIIEAAPHLVSLSRNDKASSPPAWNTQFLFAAATTFATVLFTPHHDTTAWPSQDLDWFAEALIDVTETFDVIARGAHTHTAQTCKRLLLALCEASPRQTLQRRFQDLQRERRRSSETVAVQASSTPLHMSTASTGTQLSFTSVPGAPGGAGEGTDQAAQDLPFFTLSLAEWATLTADLDMSLSSAYG